MDQAVFEQQRFAVVVLEGDVEEFEAAGVGDRVALADDHARDGDLREGPRRGWPGPT